MSDDLNEHLKRPGTWRRILFMLIFAVILGFVRILFWAVVVFQVMSTLLTGSTNPNALKFGKTLSVYLYQIMLFLTYNTEMMPFPFSDWDENAAVVDRQSKGLDD